ncbi:ferritin-like domain-containing protein [Segetibacter sp. 3557_3]|uniref:YciE/YciF ferroxidase family protein n=1 Tax=Segetibacter sp. 3557_3 TaxID=2547429 RepID=UPI001058F7D9|nr:ferritin-like domain-containing protein [Segetibacter sp. 3557_3]TDH27238.1 ferritin-like domain-containing protein [Segetibacter sp. 3557_3]
MTKTSKSASGKHIGAGASNSLLKEFFVEELQDIYYAEKQIAKTLPKMKKAATSEQLKQAFEEHLTMTQQQIERLEQVFQSLGEKAKAKTCEAIEGIIKEGEGIISDTDKNTATRDVGLIFAAQKVEHYEIATYGGLATLAETLGLSDVATLLHTTLEEEKQTDVLLTTIAENNINYQAAGEPA